MVNDILTEWEHAMEFQLAEKKHLETLCRITEEAKAQLKRLGVDQWQKGYPSREAWARDIRSRRVWLAMEEETIHGAFIFQTEPEPSYEEIDGQWLTDGPYASFHRVCVSDASKGRGVAGALFRHGFALAEAQGLPAVRIDTHRGNLPMQRALQKSGFVPCGTIHLKTDDQENGDLRVAFEKRL